MAEGANQLLTDGLDRVGLVLATKHGQGFVNLKRQQPASNLRKLRITRGIHLPTPSNAILSEPLQRLTKSSSGVCRCADLQLLGVQGSLLCGVVIPGFIELGHHIELRFQLIALEAITIQRLLGELCLPLHQR